MVDVIGFDADDTLWHNERIYQATQAEFRGLLAQYHDERWIEKRLFETEERNLQHYGYGVKAFMLSMVETAIQLTEGRITATEIHRIIELGRTMLSASVTLLDGVEESLAEVSRHHELVLITKGDLLDQENKIEKSGLRKYFRHIEIVTRKEPGIYRRVLEKHGVAADRFAMVGDSLRSDVLPVLEIGGHAIHIPHATPWLHEVVDAPDPAIAGYVQLERIGMVPEYLSSLER